ncbi:unnamed protein product [Fraxinus pennsylvanica]|uniref:CBM-cenC domain-containing protein n=1 Tax=Fraxinus pennsylvanica TaxID=56036 RepID=A0AAD2DZ51_9LAMI|nr:unnamed protein product [Fraxinus pennsylvanica]
MEPQYSGGMVLNPELEHGLKGWTPFGDAKLEQQESEDGNKYIVASDRSGHRDSFSQKFHLEEEKLYVLSAWLQVSHGQAHIAAIFKTRTGDRPAGWVMARQGCWSMLKGGIVVDASGLVELFFQVERWEVSRLAGAGGGAAAATAETQKIELMMRSQGVRETSNKYSMRPNKPNRKKPQLRNIADFYFLACCTISQAVQRFVAMLVDLLYCRKESFAVEKRTVHILACRAIGICIVF